MTAQTNITASDLYTRIATAVVSNPELESALLADFDGAVSRHFGVKLPKPATLARTTDGFLLTYDGKTYDLGDPRNAKPGELNDAELELVSGGGDGCQENKPLSNAPLFSNPDPAITRSRLRS